MIDYLAPLGDRPDTLTDVIYARIHEAIVSRALPPGGRITESGMADQLKVSKTPVREALLRLREVGLVEADGVRGNRVIKSSPEALAHAYEIREVLEAFTTRVAVDRARSRDLSAISTAAEESLISARVDAIDRFRAADRTFHRAIATAAGNPRVVKALEDAGALIQALRLRDLPNTAAVVECAEAHVRIATAIADGRGESAAQEMRTHIRSVQAYLSMQTAS